MNRVATQAEVFEEDFYSKGYAVCQADIINDTIYFKFRKEEYDLPARKAWKLVVPGWQMLAAGFSNFNAAKISGVRALAKKLRKANG